MSTSALAAALVAAIGAHSANAQQLAIGPTSNAPIIEPRMVFAHADSTAAGRDPFAPRRAALLRGSTLIGSAHRPRTDWWAPVASAIVPGAGQARLDQDRFVAYLAMEGFLWARYFVDLRQGLQERNRYRTLALEVSRAPFAGPKPQGDFEYYERMEHWIASGVYDGDPGGAFAPETDTTTFNGAMWALARRTYWTSENVPPPVGSDAYNASIAFYKRYAVPSEFRWSWRDTPLHQDIYARHIRASNDGFRRAIDDVSAVIANHVLSTVDAYVSLRLRLRETSSTSDAGYDVSATIPLSTVGKWTRLGRRGAAE